MTGVQGDWENPREMSQYTLIELSDMFRQHIPWLRDARDNHQTSRRWSCQGLSACCNLFPLIAFPQILLEQSNGTIVGIWKINITGMPTPRAPRIAIRRSSQRIERCMSRT